MIQADVGREAGDKSKQSAARIAFRSLFTHHASRT
jgi:hypothetical protein